MKSESRIQNEIRLGLNHHAQMFRINAGSVRMADGRFFQTGVPKGYSDLSGFRLKDGKAVFLEIKNARGRLQADQKRFLAAMQKKGAICGVARSVEQAINLVNGTEVQRFESN